MFGRYALPTDDLAGTYASISTSGTSVLSGSPGSPATHSDEDDEYPAEYLVAASNTGHLNLPSRPAKLTTTTGYWELAFSSAITVRAAAIIYHNFDEGLDVTLEAGSGSPLSFSHAFTIPAPHADDWTVSPWIEFSAETHAVWRLSINSANTYPVMVGRLLLIGTLRQLDSDVRWGEEEIEQHRYIQHDTELGIGTFYDLGGKERAFSGEFGVVNGEATELLTLRRSAHGRIQPWLLIPDDDVNDAWLVRFEDDAFSRVRETSVRHNNADDVFNVIPFRVRELSRGLPWP